MISAIILAAGQSKRMGQPKMTLPWGQTTVISQVVATLSRAGISDITVVTGGNREKIEEELANQSVHFVFNPDFAKGEMLSSVQCGLKAICAESEAALIALGDQPQIEAKVVQDILRSYHEKLWWIIVPSYQMHRGHPFLVDRLLWQAVLDLKSPASLKDFLDQNKEKIYYLNVNSSGIMQDIDTQKDYDQYKP
jgi:molybdenum cofactor cytidylyltransferase